MKTGKSTVHTLLSRLLRISLWLVGSVGLVALGYFVAQSGWLPGGQATQGTVSTMGMAGSRGAEAVTTLTAITVRPATEGMGTVSAAGNLELAEPQQVVVEVSGIVRTIPVAVGDLVKAGDLLATLDSREAEEAAQQALLSLASAQADLDELLTAASPAEVAAAQASLTSAQEKLADVKAGPSAQELAAARSAVAAAQASYADLESGPSGDERTQLAADMRKAEVTLTKAQSDYDAIAWRNDSGMTTQAADLQSATIDYEKAKAAYDEAVAPAADADLQNALSALSNAQKDLGDLLSQPNAADIAAAEAEVAGAQSTLDDLLNGADSSAVTSAQIAVAQARLDVDSAAEDLANTELRAPIDGAVLSVDLQPGQNVSAGAAAVTLADPNDLELTVNVAEMDVQQLTADMPVEVTIDALPGQTFSGQVLRIAPSSDPEQSVVNYPVTIQLTDDDLQGVRAGMTAVATMQNQSLAGAWLVPLSAVQEVNGVAQVTVMRDGAPITVTVTPGAIQGEWVAVEAPEIQANDQVMGDIASYVDEEQQMRFGPPGSGGPRRPGDD